MPIMGSFTQQYHHLMPIMDNHTSGEHYVAPSFCGNIPLGHHVNWFNAHKIIHHGKPWNVYVLVLSTVGTLCSAHHGLSICHTQWNPMSTPPVVVINSGKPILQPPWIVLHHWNTSLRPHRVGLYHDGNTMQCSLWVVIHTVEHYAIPIMGYYTPQKPCHHVRGCTSNTQQKHHLKTVLVCLNCGNIILFQ